MSKIKLPSANYLASFVRSTKAVGELPCGQTDDGGCNTSTILTAYALANTGAKLDFYRGKRCRHGQPVSGGQLAYLLDNYAAPAIKTACDASWKNLLRGSVAVLMYHNVYGDPNYNPLDLWCIDGCFQPQIMEQAAAKGMWIWTLGSMTDKKLAPKHSHHRAKHSAVIF